MPYIIYPLLLNHYHKNDRFSIFDKFLNNIDNNKKKVSDYIKKSYKNNDTIIKIFNGN